MGCGYFMITRLSLAANPEKSAGAGAVATIEVLPSSDFRKEISPGSSYDYKYPKSLPPSFIVLKLMNSCSCTLIAPTCAYVCVMM